MAERYERVEVALSRNTLYFLREQYGRRKSFKTVVELAAKDMASVAAKGISQEESPGCCG